MSMKQFKRKPETVHAEQLTKPKKSAVLDCLKQRVTYYAFAGEWEVWKEGAQYPVYLSEAEFKQEYEEASDVS